MSIVIPTWNGLPLLERFLPSVIAAAGEYAVQRNAGCEVVIVDDGSRDGTAEWVEGLAKQSPVTVKLVRHDINLGFGAAANRGVGAAAHPLVWLLNNDVEVERDGVSALADAFDGQTDRLFAVHSRMIDLATGCPVGTGKMGGFTRGFLRVHRSFVTIDRARSPFWSMFATGGSAMFRRSLFLLLGGFDGIFTPFYMEDVELSYRAWKRGYEVRYEPRSIVKHQFSSTIGPLAGRRIARISQRNRLLFHWIHLHSPRLMLSHVFWVTVLLLTGPLTFKLAFVSGFVDAAGRLAVVRRRRHEEIRAAVRSDLDVLGVFAALDVSGAIRSYGDPNQIDESLLAELSTNPSPGVGKTVG